MKRCKQCKRPFDETFAVCRRCREKERVRWRQRYQHRKDKGLCVACGKNPSTKSNIMCRGCYGNLEDKNKLRKRPWTRFSGPCVLCQFPWSDVHHIDEDKKNNRPENLVSLCPNHHRLAHKGLLKVLRRSEQTLVLVISF